jgi:hypothetical protein
MSSSETAPEIVLRGAGSLTTIVRSQKFLIQNKLE